MTDSNSSPKKSKLKDDDVTSLLDEEADPNGGKDQAKVSVVNKRRYVYYIVCRVCLMLG
jgi:hypothetical protein